MSPYGADGVDVSLIRWMLAMTPAERLATLQEFVDFVSEARGEDAEEPVRVDPADAQ
ncbi:MAG TPA: hypothetical protein VLY04_22780 [Bryobacteraceae bacterium]|nr:hypothetical protein [Bryobacteraceae bacterium]